MPVNLEIREEHYQPWYGTRMELREEQCYERERKRERERAIYNNYRNRRITTVRESYRSKRANICRELPTNQSGTMRGTVPRYVLQNLTTGSASLVMLEEIILIDPATKTIVFI